LFYFINHNLKNFFKLLILLCSLGNYCQLKSQNINQNVIASSCGIFSNGNILLNSTLGEIFSQSFNNTSLLNQGFHQSISKDSGIVLSIKVFIESLYIGNGKMKNMTSIPNLSSTTTDIVFIELHNSSFPFERRYMQSSILKIDGKINTTFPFDVLGESFYIVIKHRNSIETWSANPVLFGSNIINYDFTTSLSKAFGDNQSFLANGIFAIYSGDVNQDGFIDGNDYIQIDNDNSRFLNGFSNTDLNGDGFVDGNDFIQIDNNNSNFIGAIVP